MPVPSAAAVLALAAPLILIGVLLGQVGVQRRCVRVGAVRLRRRRRCGLAVHAHRGVAVRRAELQRGGQGKRPLVVLGRLADRLDGDPAAAGLILIRVLLERVQVRGRRVGVDAVRLLDVAAVRPCCPRGPGCSCCSPRTGARTTELRRPARSSPPGRSPGCRSRRGSHNPCCPTGPGRRPAWSGWRSAPSHPNRRCSTATRRRRRPCCRPAPGRSCCSPRTAARPRGRLRTARCRPPGRSPGCHRNGSHSPCALAALILIRVLLGQVQVGSGRRRSRRCSTGTRRRRHPCCPDAPGCSCCSHPAALRVTLRTRAGRCRLPGRSPASRRSRTDPDPRPASARSGSPRSPTSRRSWTGRRTPPSPLLSRRTGVLTLPPESQPQCFLPSNSCAASDTAAADLVRLRLLTDRLDAT